MGPADYRKPEDYKQTLDRLIFQILERERERERKRERERERHRDRERERHTRVSN